MDLSGIISISGMPGLYKVVGQTKGGFIAESLIDKKRIPAYSHYKVSALEDISMFSTGDDVPLKDVFQKIADKEKYGPAIDSKKSDDELKKYFGEAFAEYDKDRVYISDIRKAIGWYNLLQKNDLLKAEVKSDNEDDKNLAKAVTEEKSKSTLHKAQKDIGAKPMQKNPPKKTMGVRKTGTA